MHTISLNGTTLDLDARCHYMGIVNVTPDSFSDGGRTSETGSAVAHALRLADEGADVVDVGGESTRPGSTGVDADEELRRVIPVIRGIRAGSAVPVSIDTRKARVAEAALAAGASIVNDISALRHDPGMARVVAEAGVPVVLMHMRGEPETMQRGPFYTDVVGELETFFAERLAACAAAGIDRVILDPGIGFGKRVEDNCALLACLDRFASFGRPLLVGTSRKSFIGAITGAPVDDRLPGTIASCVLAVERGARLLRVHDVAAVRQAVRVAEAVRDAAAEEAR